MGGGVLYFCLTVGGDGLACWDEIGTGDLDVGLITSTGTAWTGEYLLASPEVLSWLLV